MLSIFSTTHNLEPESDHYDVPGVGTLYSTLPGKLYVDWWYFT